MTAYEKYQATYNAYIFWETALIVSQGVGLIAIMVALVSAAIANR